MSFLWKTFAGACVALLAVIAATGDLAGLMARYVIGVTPVRAERAEVIFIDSAVFDRALTEALERGTREIVLTLPSRVDMHAIPERLDKWLAVVQGAGGNVAVRPLAAPTGMAWKGSRDEAAVEVGRRVARDLFRIYDYALAGSYHAAIEFRSESGRIERILFLHK